jgi:glycosyltransferase involved in cell wall biosynthesis
VKILSVIEAFCHGGAQSVLLDTVLSLREHQHRVVHFSRANGIAAEVSFIEKLREAGIECIDTHWNSIRDDGPRAQLLEDFQPDVVMFHWWGKDPWMPWVLSRSAGAPAFVCVMHHAVYPAQAGYDRYVLVSRSQLPQVAHIAPHRVEVIPNGLDLTRFPIRTARRTRENRPLVVGRLSELREGKIPLEWMSTIKSFGLADMRFVIAGDGALLPKLRESASELGLASQVSFPGYVARDEVPALLETFDAFCYVTSSALECCPLAILEAMAAGVPVVAEARGGIPEIVVDGENGLLSNSMSQIGNHLRRLRDDEALRERLARGARATAEKFSLANQIAAYRDLVTELAGERERIEYRTSETSMEKPGNHVH